MMIGALGGQWSFHSKGHSPVDTGDVNDDINHVAAQLVRLHVYWTAVSGDVDLADHVEQKSLFDPRILQIRANHGLEASSLA